MKSKDRDGVLPMNIKINRNSTYEQCGSPRQIRTKRKESDEIYGTHENSGPRELKTHMNERVTKKNCE